jgi:peptidoglycan/xylan/chitin deacetylase (PgdA/CDA1 family)
MAARELTLSGAPVLMYHGLGAAVPADAGTRETKYWVAPAAFARQLAQIREAGQRVRRLYEFWSGEPDAPENQSSVVLTFDDGRATDYEVAFPLLLAAGARAEFFINTATIERAGHLTWSQIVEMHRAGMSFQSHAHDHVLLPALPERLIRNELQTSKRLIEDRVGRGVDFLAAPYGLLDRRVIDVAREVGYQAVCSSRSWPARPGGAIVHRVAVYRETAAARFAGILARQPRAYLPSVARTALAYLPKRVLLKLRPSQLGAQLHLEGA